MKAMVRDRYGSPDVLRLEEIEQPELTAGGVLVRVKASSINRADWYGLTAPLFLRALMGAPFRPKQRVLGVDFAGTVEAVGKDVTGFEVGDEVFGGRSGAFAEYVVVENGIAHRPENVSVEEAASVGVAGLTALQGLRDKAGVQPGQKVLVNGASGGVGTFAIQVAKALGAEVTAVCSTRNVEQARALGADRVVDYTQEDFTRLGERFDVIYDVAGSRGWGACKRVLRQGGVLVQAGGPKRRLIGPLGHIAGKKLASVPGDRRVVFFVAKFNREDIEALRDLLAEGKLTPVVERTYPLEQLPEAMRYHGEGHSRAKVVITVP
jgi:NADPH:quinone reductase-like Zn-dependent oxidoreductase